MAIVIIPILIYFIWTWRKDKKIFEREGKVVFSIRIIAILCLILGLTNPYLLLPIKEEQVLFLVDRSASLQGTDQQITAWIDESLQSRKASHLVGVYTFAEDFQTEVSLTEGEVNLPVFTPYAEPGNTDIARAFSYLQA